MYLYVIIFLYNHSTPPPRKKVKNLQLINDGFASITSPHPIPPNNLHIIFTANPHFLYKPVEYFLVKFSKWLF